MVFELGACDAPAPFTLSPGPTAMLCPLCDHDSLRSLPYQAGVFLVPATAMITIALDIVKRVWSLSGSCCA